MFLNPHKSRTKIGTKTHRNSGLAAAGANVPGEVASRSLGGNELEELLWVTWPSFRVLLSLLDKQIRHFPPSALYNFPFLVFLLGCAD